MNSTCKSVVGSLRSFHSKLTSALDEIPCRKNHEICVRLKNYVEKTLRDLKFLLPLVHRIHNKYPSLAIKIQAVIHEVKEEELETVWYDICEMKKGGQTTLLMSFPSFWRKDIRKRASKLIQVLSDFCAMVSLLLLPEIRETCGIIWREPFQSHFSCDMSDIYNWKEFGWLVSSLCSCLSILERRSKDDLRIRALGFQKTLQDLEIFLHGLPHDISGVEDISIQLAPVANRALIACCEWWLQCYPSADDEARAMTAPLDLQENISATAPGILDKMLRLLVTLKATDSSLLDQKVIEFAQYVLPYKMGPVEFTKEMETLSISVLSSLPTIAGGEIIRELLQLKQLIFEIEKFFSCGVPEDGYLLLNLLAKIWLIKVEAIFIKKLGDTWNRLPLSQKCQFNQGLQHIRESPQGHLENVSLISQFVATLGEGYFQDATIIVKCLILLKIQLSKLERKLHDHNRISNISIKDKVKSLHEGFKFLINYFISRRKSGTEWDGTLCGHYKRQIEAMAYKVVRFCHENLTPSITEEMIQGINLLLSDTLDEIKIIIAQHRDICLVPMSNFPKTNALGFYDSLLSRLQELTNRKADRFHPVKQYMEEILADLQFLRHFLGDILWLGEEIQELRDLSGHAIDAAYNVEYLVESIVNCDEPEWHNWIWLCDLLQKIRYIRMQAIKVQEKRPYDVKAHNAPQTSSHVVSKASTPRIDDVVLSLHDQQDLIIDKLVGGSPQRDIVSIVGMPGIGKTTLAKKVYSSPIIAHHFHIRAWCCVTEVYRKRELLLEILSHVIPLTDTIHRMSDEDLDFRLRQLLLKKRYFIVMDDMWSTEAWEDLRASFPDENGSRILITSRLNEVALKAKSHSYVHHLRLLSDAESWALLKMRIFEKECCPPELIEDGQEIAKSCKGLPLAIAAMAGILEGTDRKGNQWKEITKNLRARIVDDPQEQCRRILELSYRLLPDYLKACFLYFGAFLEDQEIPVRKLRRLWIAEGFVKKTQLKSMEDLAEDYLKDLIGRSLVIFAQPRTRGGTKACRVHDILRNFCQSKAKEENFLQVITMSNESSDTFDDLGFLVDDYFSKPSNNKTYMDYRLCFYLKRNLFAKSRPSGPYVRSLLFFGTQDKYGRSSYDVSFISGNFRRLKVLDLECINIGPSFPCGIERMMELRYLAVSGDLDSIPSSIAGMSNMETFIVKGLKGIVNLPDTIWGLKKLRHVQVTDVAVINLKDDELGNSSLLDCLVTLSFLFLRCGEGTNNILIKFPNLRKLGCMISGYANLSGACNHFPRLDVLNQLQSLKISYYGRALITAEFSFPLSLRKLTLSNFRLPWTEISAIGRLQNLEVLKLLSRAYDGEIWDMVEGEFNNLKFLKLDCLNIAKWVASRDNLPRLEKLVLRNCKHLEEVPSSFVEISTLQMIEVQWCGKFAEESARRMRDEADEFLNIIITSDVDSTSSSS